MGVWGVGVFENDDAMGWLIALMESWDITLLKESIYQVTTSSKYLQSPDCSRALASAEIIAAVKDKIYSFLPDFASEWVTTLDLIIDPGIINSSQQAIQKIMDDSELKDLWGETDSLSEWILILHNLDDRLRT